jgi:hypothetical protein
MLLRFPDGSSFATGSSQYNNAPGTELSSRIILDVVIGGQLTTAVADTGIPCSLCSPDFADYLGLGAGQKETANLLGTDVKGDIHDIDLTFVADAGRPLGLVVPMMVPADFQSVIPELAFRSHLGMEGCLNSITFAVDFAHQTFYFG